MESLETALQEVDRLSPDLHSVIVLKPAVMGTRTRIESRYPGWMYGMLGLHDDLPGEEYTEISEDYQKVPPVTTPNHEKRAETRRRVEEIARSSPTYSARYSACRALGVPKDELHRDVNEWVRLLGRNIQGESGEISEARADLSKLYDLSKKDVDGEERREIGRLLGLDELTILEREMQFRGPLSRPELRKVYSSSKNEDLINEAGHRLDYSQFRIGMRLEGLKLLATSVVFPSIIYATYMAINYLSK